MPANEDVETDVGEMLSHMLQNLPREMTEARRWLLWKAEPVPGKKPRKVPYYVNGRPRSGALDSAADRAALSGLGAAVNACADGSYAGLGFALGPDGKGGHWQGIDLDDLSGRPELKLLADDLPGYTEDSPSGNGRHAVGYGREFKALGSNASGIEAYCIGRYFTVTGERAGVGPITDLAEHVEKVLAPRHSAKTQANTERSNVLALPTVTRAAEVVHVSPEVVADLRSALLSLRADDRELWVKLGHALKTIGEPGRALWLEWSATSEKFDAADAARVWDSFRPNGIDYRAVFTQAQAAGWLNPASNVASKASHVPADGGSSMTYPLLRDADLQAMPPARWLISGVLPEKGLSFITGRPGSGKTFLAIDMAASVASGRPWHGLKVRQAPVAYLALEGAAGMKGRSAAWRVHNGQEFPDSVRWGLHGFNASSATEVQALGDAVLRELGPGACLFVDTLARSTAGLDENATAEMGAFVAHMEELAVRIGGSVVVLHHPSKSDPEGMRGSGALLGAAQGHITVARDGEVRTWVVKKAKDGRDGATGRFALRVIQLGLDDDGEPVTSCAVQRLEPVEIDLAEMQASGLGGNQRLAMDRLRPLLLEAGSLPLGLAISAVAEVMNGEERRRPMRAKEAITGLIKKRRLFQVGATVRLTESAETAEMTETDHFGNHGQSDRNDRMTDDPLGSVGFGPVGTASVGAEMVVGDERLN